MTELPVTAESERELIIGYMMRCTQSAREIARSKSPASSDILRAVEAAKYTFVADTLEMMVEDIRRGEHQCS